VTDRVEWGERAAGDALETDTIVARATPPGIGAIAVVRLSGRGAREVLRRLAPGSADGEDRQACLVGLQDPCTGAPIDQALVTFFRGPASYTGEDVVEISVHGGTLPSQGVIDACVRLGARPAAPGEFTRRAYLNGKLDLLQAEAVADLVTAKSQEAHSAAIHQLQGALSARVERLRARLLQLEALLAHHLDFPDEDEPPTPVGGVIAEGEAVFRALQDMLGLAPEGLLLREGAVVVLAGRPNAGKSSLFNALLGEERAIVTAEPGTTRDAVEAHLDIGGFPFRLVDTAGLRDAPGEVERLGVEIAERYLEHAQVVLFCHPADQGWEEEEREIAARIPPERVLWVRTCIDRGDGEMDRVGVPFLGAGIGVSTVTGEGVAEVRASLKERVFSGLVEVRPELGVLTRPRQRERMKEAQEELRAFVLALRDGVPADLAAVRLRGARESLEELVGVSDHDEVLDVLFRSFCIGK
jgi:tRNA modification GTPase